MAKGNPEEYKRQKLILFRFSTQLAPVMRLYRDIYLNVNVHTKYADKYMTFVSIVRL